jgi:predicted phage terminase large subunit-like protein
MLSKKEAAAELLRRRTARRQLAHYISFTNPHYKVSNFSKMVCAALDSFIEDVHAGKRPILVLQAPPQHGKSEIVSRKLPAYLLGRHPNLRIGAASYSDELANAMAQDVRRNIADPIHFLLFAHPQEKRRYDINRIGEFTAPGGSGGYLGVGVGAGLTGRPVDIGIIDDPVKNEKEALSETIKNGHWDWYQSVFTTRLSEYSGQIIMATSWAEDDLPARICNKFRGDSRLKELRFPAINLPDEVGYDHELPTGALVPELKSLEFLKEIKGLFSDYWWSAMYQQSPRALGGNVFKEEHIQYYLPKDLPKKFEKVIASWDCTFKDTDGSDYVVGQVWAKSGANSYLLDQIRGRMSFTKTADEVKKLKDKWPNIREILIEDKANGPAVIDTLKGKVSGIIPIEPDGSKLARAHAITSYWEAMNIFLPHQDIAPWITEFIRELTAFPVSANDDQVDALTQGLRRLYPLFNRIRITQEALDRVQRKPIH